MVRSCKKTATGHLNAFESGLSTPFGGLGMIGLDGLKKDDVLPQRAWTDNHISGTHSFL